MIVFVDVVYKQDRDYLNALLTPLIQWLKKEYENQLFYIDFFIIKDSRTAKYVIIDVMPKIQPKGKLNIN